MGEGLMAIQKLVSVIVAVFLLFMGLTGAITAVFIWAKALQWLLS